MKGPVHPRKIALVVNPGAGSGRALKLADEIAGQLRRRDLDYQIYTTDWPADFQPFTEVWIVGGDGTLHYFINCYPDIVLPLVIFKGGSGNDFHWMLYGDQSQDKILSLVLEKDPRPVDAGICNDRLFLNGLGIGFDGAVSAKLKGVNKRLGKASFLKVVLRTIFSFREDEFRWDAGATGGQEAFLMINVMNGRRAGGGFYVTPQAEVDDGLLDLNMIRPLPWWRRLILLPRIEKGAHLHLPCVYYSKIKRIRIQASFEVPAHCDGESFRASNFDIRVLPGKFRFRF